MGIFLYGPPGSGKSSVAKILAKRLDMPLADIDRMIEQREGQPISAIFASKGEGAFREIEKNVIKEIAAGPDAVVALGGGALLAPESRRLVEHSGEVLFLDVDREVLAERMSYSPGTRPLVNSDRPQTVFALLDKRAEHYASFANRIKVGRRETVSKVADRIQERLGRFAVKGLSGEYRVDIGNGLLDRVGFAAAALGRVCRAVLVGDENSMPLYGAKVEKSLSTVGIKVTPVTIPPGEQHKTIATVEGLWSRFRAVELTRDDLVVALGGGVVGEMSGFAAACWMRGIRWINLPTTLLAMVDAGIGGKTGVDLPEGKNLVGAFHPPAAVLSDTSVLGTLPAREWRCGLAEAIKHDVLADIGLRYQLGNFRMLRDASPDAVFDGLASEPWLPELVSKAVAVKVRVVIADPFERGIRATLNLGHTIGHALEKVSGFKIRHGEAVAIGTVAAARLAQSRSGDLGWSPRAGFLEELKNAFSSVGLPVDLPEDLDWRMICSAMRNDKKRQQDSVRFVFPYHWGGVKIANEPLSRLELGLE